MRTQIPTRTFAGFSGYQGKGLYWRNDYAEYGRQTAFPLQLQAGSYTLTHATAAWKGTPQYKVQILLADTDEVIAESSVYTAAPNANGNNSADLTSATTHELAFTIAEAGNYAVRFSDTTTGSGYHEFLLLECRINSESSETPGDIDGDGQITVSDITALISIYLGTTSADTAVCDTDGDGELTLSDITTLIHLYLGQNDGE